jgi:hypothetical protein
MSKHKICFLSIIGPRSEQSHFPSDLDLHVFGRSLIECDDNFSDADWVVATKLDWGNHYPPSENTTVYQLTEAEVPDLRSEHPSMDHGAMLNFVCSRLPDETSHLVVIDPDCFVTDPQALALLIDEMDRDGVSVVGTPYGMQFPKNYFRDFPTLFLLVIDVSRINLGSLDFRPQLVTTTRTGSTAGYSSLLSRLDFRGVRNLMRMLISQIIRVGLGVNDPLRWWGFLMDHRRGIPDVLESVDTGFALREELIGNNSHKTLKVVVAENVLPQNNVRSPVAYRSQSDPAFGSSRYFRNHGVFEGWQLFRGSFQDFLTNAVARVSAKDVGEVVSSRFPTTSMIPTFEVNQPQLVRQFMSEFPQADLWAHKENIIAVHLGYGTKNTLSKDNDWSKLKNMIQQWIKFGRYSNGLRGEEM